MNRSRLGLLFITIAFTSACGGADGLDAASADDCELREDKNATPCVPTAASATPTKGGAVKMLKYPNNFQFSTHTDPAGSNSHGGH
jgi:hypothetical protein